MYIPDDVPLSDFRQFYLAKDGVMKWSKIPPRQNVRVSSYNIIKSKHKVGVRNKAKNEKTPLDAFSLYFDDFHLEKIEKYTSIYIEKIRPKFARERDALDTNKAEIKALLELLFLASVA